MPLVKIKIPVYVTMMLDSATSQKKWADYNGFTVVGCDPDDNWYVLEAQQLKAAPDAVIARTVALALKYRPRRFAIDALGAQVLYKPLILAEFKKFGISLPIDEYRKANATNSKRARIEAMQPRFKQGKIFIKAGQNELLDQLDGFPDLDHDDLLDSLCMHMEYARPADPREFIPDVWEEEWQDEDQEKHERLDGTWIGRGTPSRA